MKKAEKKAPDTRSGATSELLESYHGDELKAICPAQFDKVGVGTKFGFPPSPLYEPVALRTVVDKSVSHIVLSIPGVAERKISLTRSDVDGSGYWIYGVEQDPTEVIGTNIKALAKVNLLLRKL